MRIVIAVSDLLAASRYEAAARAAGHEPLVRRTVPGDAADLLVVDLDAPGTLDAVREYLERNPGARVAGFAFHENRELLSRAKDLGVEVLAHGADPAVLFR